jgi:hypothetical protein
MLLFAAVLLLATPLWAEEVSPLIVETPRTTTPTVVKTGEPFEQIYKIRFLDLIELGEEVVIREDSLKSAMLGDFEVLRFDSSDRRIEERSGAKEHIWFLKYTLRIVNPEKKGYTIPSITIPWILKKIGQQDGDPSIVLNTNIKTDEVHVNYVTTMTKDPLLNIRDQIDFGDYDLVTKILRWTSRSVMAAVLLLAWVLGASLSKRPQGGGEKNDLAEDKVSIPYVVSPINTSKMAWRNLRQILGRMKTMDSSSPVEQCAEMEKVALRALKDFLRAGLSRDKIGYTPLDLLKYWENEAGLGHKRVAYLALAQTAAIYQSDVDRKLLLAMFIPVLEAKKIEVILRNFRWYFSFWDALLNFFRRVLALTPLRWRR